MTDINAGPLTKRAYELCRRVDSLPHASLELTAAVTALSEFIQMCETHEKAATRALVKYKEWEDAHLMRAEAVRELLSGIKHDADCPRRGYGRALPKCDCGLDPLNDAIEYLFDEP